MFLPLKFWLKNKSSQSFDSLGCWCGVNFRVSFWYRWKAPNLCSEDHKGSLSSYVLLPKKFFKLYMNDDNLLLNVRVFSTMLLNTALDTHGKLKSKCFTSATKKQFYKSNDNVRFKIWQRDRTPIKQWYQFERSNHLSWANTQQIAFKTSRLYSLVKKASQLSLK